MADRTIGPGSLVASRFRLEELLEEHSGARLWCATDLTLARTVAIHVIDADDPRAAAVLTAARTSATVSDGRILRVLDALDDGLAVYVVHEWCPGAPLDQILADEPLEPRRAAWLVREVAEAIVVAHRYGVAHGRLLPENVMVTDAGALKLIGFVVDAVLQGRSESPVSEHESDVVNLGALLYACLTRKWPGQPGSVLRPAPRDHDRVCRPRQVRPGVPKPLDLLCDQLLNPGTRGPRFETAADVAAALGDYLGDTVSGAAVTLDPGAEDDRYAADGEPTMVGFDPDATQAHLPALDSSAPGAAAIDDPEATGYLAPPASLAVPPPTTAPVPASVAHGRPAARMPDRWGPDRYDDSGPPVRRRGLPGSGWFQLAILFGLIGLILLGILFAANVGGIRSSVTPSEPSSSPSGSHSPGAVLKPASVRDFDPEQTGGPPAENPDQVPLATDGDPSTAWTTLKYDDGPVLAPYKSGVGLLLDLGSEKDVSQVTVTLDGSSYDLSLLAAPEGTGTPTSTSGLRTVAKAAGASGEVRLTPDAELTSRYLVVWLTALPATSDGRYQGSVAEVVVRS